MQKNQHLTVDKFFFGEEITYSHEWLDATFGEYVNTNPYKHWLNRHYEEAVIEEFGKGTKLYNSAMMHILCDMLSHFGIFFVPRTRQELQKFLKSRKII